MEQEFPDYLADFYTDLGSMPNQINKRALGCGNTHKTQQVKDIYGNSHDINRIWA